MERIVRAIVFAFFTFLASAHVQNVAAQSAASVLVNGQMIKGRVLEIDGKHFVAVEDLAQSLRGTISYSDGQVALTLPPAPATAAEPTTPQPAYPTAAMPSVSHPSMKSAEKMASTPPTNIAPPSASQVSLPAPQNAGSGIVKGTLTYFFDFHTGSKPDTGSKVWLVKDRIEIPADQIFVGSATALGTSANPEQYATIQYAVVDGKGEFEFLDVPSGQYTLILQSAHTKGTLKDKRNLFGRGNSPNPRDRDGRVESLNVLIKSGETVDASTNFGPNAE